jgi:hypothetical protein
VSNTALSELLLCSVRDVHPIPGNPGNEQPGQGAPGPHLHPIFEMLMHFMANRAFPGTARQGRCGGGTAARRDGVRVFEEFAWPKADSVKVALSRPAWWLTAVGVSKPTSTPEGA